MSGYFLRLLARAAGGVAEDAATSEPVADAVFGERAPVRAIDAVTFRPRFAATPPGAPRPAAGLGATTAQGDGVAAPRVAMPKSLSPVEASPTAQMAEGRREPIARPDREPASPAVPPAPAVVRAQAPSDPALPPSAFAEVAGDRRPPERATLPDALLPAVARAGPIAPATNPPAAAPAAADPTPAVHITIGRIDVVASPPPTTAPAAPRPAPAHAPQSLDAYLSQRARVR